MYAAIKVTLSPAVCRRIKQELANSTLTENELVDRLLTEALNARAETAKELIV